MSAPIIPGTSQAKLYINEEPTGANVPVLSLSITNSGGSMVVKQWDGAQWNMISSGGAWLVSMSAAPGEVAKLNYGAVSARVALPSGAKRVQLRAPTALYFKFGDVTVEAANTDPIFDPGTQVYTVPAGATHIAALRVASDGTLDVLAVS